MDLEQTLILIVVLCVFVAIVFALIRGFGIPIPPLVLQIGGYLLLGIVLVLVIRLLWPLLFGGGSLRVGMIAPMLGIG